MLHLTVAEVEDRLSNISEIDEKIVELQEMFNEGEIGQNAHMNHRCRVQGVANHPIRDKDIQRELDS